MGSLDQRKVRSAIRIDPAGRNNLHRRHSRRLHPHTSLAVAFKSSTCCQGTLDAWSQHYHTAIESAVQQAHKVIMFSHFAPGFNPLPPPKSEAERICSEISVDITSCKDQRERYLVVNNFGSEVRSLTKVISVFEEGLKVIALMQDLNAITAVSYTHLTLPTKRIV